MAKSTARRRRGEGSVQRFHNHPTCPPVGDDGVRPDHRCLGPWRGSTVVDDGITKKRRQVYGATEAEVLRKMRDLTVAQATGTLVVTTTTVGEWAESWLAECWPRLKVNTRTSYRSVTDRYIVKHLGAHRLDQLQPRHVRDMYAALRAEGKSEGTVRGVHVLLHRMLKVAMREGMVARNVTELIDPPKTGTAVARRGLTLDEAKRVLAVAGDNPRYWVALMCGLRQGEALALRWCDIDLDAMDDGHPAPYLVVRRSLCREPGVGLVFTTPKSAKSRDRVVPLPVPVAARLRVAYARHRNGGGTDDALVFGTPKGTPKEPSRDYEGWCQLLAAAGVDHTPLHAARNTAAALLEDAGNPPRVVAEILGHTNVAMTYRYQGGNTGAKVRAMRALDRLADFDAFGVIGTGDEVATA